MLLATKKEVCDPLYGISIKDIQYLGVERSQEVHHQHLQIEREEKDAGECHNHSWKRGAECRVSKVNDGLSVQHLGLHK